MSGNKKRAADDTSHVKQKRHKKADISVDEAEESTFEAAELLDAQTIREGMLLLGCVIVVKPTFLEISLPGFLFGRVPLNNISSPFTKSLRDFATNADMEEPSLSFVKEGMIFPCRVIEIPREPSKKKTFITLSINPVDINADLKPSLLYPKMVLYVSVCSIEDHGCVVDIGNKSIKGFLHKQHYQDHREEFKVGEVIPTFIKQISSDKTSARIQLSPLDFKKPFPSVTIENVNLTSILPGAKILADVIDIKHPFIYLKYMCFDACANILSFGPAYTSIKIGKQVCGTVLYIHPITHMIYLSLNLSSSPDLLGLRKYASVKNLKYFCSYKKFYFYTIKKGTLGFFHVKDLPKSASKETVSKACILQCHYIDNLVQLSAKASWLEKNIIFTEDVQVGDIYEAVVLNHINKGMFVSICPGVCGFVRRIHMSDVFVTKPEILYPVGSKVKCRVLYTDGKNKLNLTCKESLLRLEDQYILSSYKNVQKGQFYKGVIVQKTDDFILVLFFNDIKGIVPLSYVPKGSIFFEGQTVLCKVTSYNSSKKKLRLSLETGERCSSKEISNFSDESTENNVNGRKNVFNHEREIMHLHNSINSENLISKTCNNMDILSSDVSSSPVRDEIKCETPRVKAVIESIKGSQLNNVLNKSKGRVHITKLGRMLEKRDKCNRLNVLEDISWDE